MAGQYHAVSIRSGPRSCSAAKQIKDARFLSLEAPSIPLDGCPKPRECRCRYRHHEDRRDGPRRDIDVGLPGVFWTLDERREISVGRRASDRSAA